MILENSKARPSVSHARKANRKAILLGAGWLCFVVSFFVPATFINDRPVPGWEACWFALDGNWLGKVSALTSFLILATPFTIRGSRGASVTMGLALVGAIVLNLFWLSTGLTVGYYLWVASFALIATAFLLAAAKAK